MTPENPKRTKRLEIRVTTGEQAAFRTAAKAAGESHTGTWLRKVGLKAARDIRPRAAGRTGRAP